MNRQNEIAEANARSAAVSRYRQWLLRRFKKLDLVELSDETKDPIELQQIFVPVRLGRENLSDDTGFQDEEGDPIPAREETLPGRDAFEVLAQQPFVAISGHPGSGKTTLVHALVAALSDLRAGELRRATRAVPVPFILRRIPGLGRVETLEDLFAAWWQDIEAQAMKDEQPLDRARLETILRPDSAAGLEEQPVLLLFDGLDEVGGAALRQTLLNLAALAHGRGYRVVVTGRPAGYEALTMPETWPGDPRRMSAEAKTPAGGELSLRALAPLHIQPFAWPQIEQFITRWYALRDEWQRDAEQGIGRFLDHLADPSRRSLLVLARRPIFLALMALVNCVENQMPEGRARLYARIVDLYLARQERHRRRRVLTDGQPIPPWAPEETMRVLSRLARISQDKGTEGRRAHDEDQRRFLWSVGDLVEETEEIIRAGRFKDLRADDAETLVRYFLNPAGLLVAPTEEQVQFAHLSFQEYLCAVDLYDEAKGSDDGVYRHAQREIFPLFEHSGWQEVGILFLCVCSDDTRQQGHLKLMRRLDPSRPGQARLYVEALCGHELQFVAEERCERLPAALVCALLHTRFSLGEALGQQPELAQDGLRWLLRLLEAPNDQARWEQLAEAVGEARPTLVDSLDGAMKRWIELGDETGWHVEFGPEESRAHSLFGLVADAGWGLQDDIERPVSEPALVEGLAGFVGQSAAGGLLWVRNKASYPVPTNALLALDRLVPREGPLWRAASKAVPLDLMYLQGEICNADYLEVRSQPLALLHFDPAAPTLPVHLGNAILQGLVLVGALARESQAWEPFSCLVEALKRSVGRLLVIRHYKSHLRACSLSDRISGQYSRVRSLAFSFARSALYCTALADSLSLSSEIQARLERWLTATDYGVSIVTRQSGQRSGVSVVLTLAGLRYAGYEFFDRQARDPDLVRRRGLEPGRPFPHDFGFFDAEGRLLTTQKRASIEELLDWMSDRERVLDDVFARPNAPPLEDSADRDHLLGEMEILWNQPWGPIRHLKAVLKDWPDDQEEVDVSMEAAERRLVEALEAAGY